MSRAKEILKRVEVGAEIPTYVLGYGARQVTIHAQQVRALELMWALDRDTDDGKAGALVGREIVVVGGGIGGVTAAAAATLFGATVTILEEGPALMHLQRGCHHRYLHPHIYEWPNDRRARYAGAHLPILSWNADSADEVAERILVGYRRISRLADGRPITAHCFVRDVKFDGGDVHWRVTGDDAAPDPIQPAAVVLAVGFGVERTVQHLPLLSYWRVDSITQSPLAHRDGNHRTLVAGTGDGGIIDVLRACLLSVDHGAFMDEALLILKDRRLVAWVNKVEGRVDIPKTPREREEPRWRHEASIQLDRCYDNEYGKDGDIRRVLDQLWTWLDRLQRPRTEVYWLGSMPSPADINAQPLNRLLGWLLHRKGCVQYLADTRIDHVDVLDPARPGGFRYTVRLGKDKAETRWLDVHDVVLRIGARPALDRHFPAIAEELKDRDAPADVVGPLDDEIRLAYTSRLTETGATQRPSRKELEANLSLHAVVEGDPGRAIGGDRSVYRIRIWMSGRGLEDLEWVDYDLHPEYGTVTRRAIRVPNPTRRQQFRHWINTGDDHWIRVRCSDGSELGAWVSEVVERTDKTVRGARCCRYLREHSVHPDGYLEKHWSAYTDSPTLRRALSEQ
jgi:hypothetical protein